MSNVINLPNNTAPIHTKANTSGGTTYTVIISGPILDPTYYYGLLQLLTTATANDTIFLKLSSPGGSVEIGGIICNAIFNSKAKVITQAIGITASIAAVIWCCGKQRSINPTATLMFHMPSGISMGKTADIEEQSGYMQTYFKDLLKSLTKRILTEEEYDQMVTGRRDIFISYKELRRRLVRKDK